MKTLKAFFIICLAIISSLASASEWSNINLSRDGYSIRIGYTRQWLPATYGFNGGMATGLLYVDVYSRDAAKAESVTLGNIQAKLIEDSSTHFWSKLSGPSYAHHVMIGSTTKLKVVIDGRELVFNVKLN